MPIKGGKISLIIVASFMQFADLNRTHQSNLSLEEEKTQHKFLLQTIQLDERGDSTIKCLSSTLFRSSVIYAQYFQTALIKHPPIAGARA
jgi:hypothetical protein